MNSGPSFSTEKPSSGCNARTARSGTSRTVSALTGTKTAPRRSGQRSPPEPSMTRCSSRNRSLVAASVRTRVATTTSMSLVRGLKAPVARDPWTYTPARCRPSVLDHAADAEARKVPTPGPPALTTRSSMPITTSLSRSRAPLESTSPSDHVPADGTIRRHGAGVVGVDVQTCDARPGTAHPGGSLGHQRTGEPQAPPGWDDADLVDPPRAADDEPSRHALHQDAERLLG